MNHAADRVDEFAEVVIARFFRASIDQWELDTVIVRVRHFHVNEGTELLSFWLAAPRDDVLLIATDKGYLESVLIRISRTGQLSFPVSEKLLSRIDQKATAWGMRMYQKQFPPTDVSDPRWHSQNDPPRGTTSGFLFSINEAKDSGEAVWLHCDTRMAAHLAKSAQQRVSQNPQECQTVHDQNGNLRIRVQWPRAKKDDQSVSTLRTRLRGSFGLWLDWNLGHAAAV